MKTFRMTYGRALPYISGAAIASMLLIAVVLLANRVWWVGGGVMLLTILFAAYIFIVLRNPPVYIIDDSTVTFRTMGRTVSYPIDRIVRVQYFDLGVEYSRGVNNSRYQLGIYFDRSLFRSVEPIAFCPDDRDGFVAALLAVNPTIPVNRQDIRPK